MRGKIQIREGTMVTDLGNYVKTLKPWMYDWEIKRWQANRSADQNRYYRYVLQLLSEHTGYEEDEMHEIVKSLFLTEKIKLRWDRRKKATLTRSTSTMTTGEFEDLMEKLRRWGATELGMNIPKPNEPPGWTDEIIQNF